MALRGEITPPGDLAISHRLALMSILADGEMSVSGFSDSPSVEHSLALFRALGGEARGGSGRLVFKGLGGRLALEPGRKMELDCGDSAVTVRLAAGIMAGLEGDFVLEAGLKQALRSFEPLADVLRRLGAEAETSAGGLPLYLRGGRLHGGEFVNSEASSQLKAAVLLAGLSASGPTTVIEPLATRDHTETLIEYFGGRVESLGEGRLQLWPSRLTLPEQFSVPADSSAAAVFLVGAALLPQSRVTANQIVLSRSRIGFLKVLDRMGARIDINLQRDRPEPNGSATVEYNGQLKAVSVEAEEIPSLVEELPLLALAAARAEGETVFRQVRAIRRKNIDRLTAIKHQLGALGVRVRVDDDDLYVSGPTELMRPESLDCGGDYGLAMMLQLARLLAGDKIAIAGEDCALSSYPAFQRDLESLLTAD